MRKADYRKVLVLAGTKSERACAEGWLREESVHALPNADFAALPVFLEPQMVDSPPLRAQSSMQ